MLAYILREEAKNEIHVLLEQRILAAVTPVGGLIEVVRPIQFDRDQRFSGEQIYFHEAPTIERYRQFRIEAERACRRRQRLQTPVQERLCCAARPICPFGIGADRASGVNKEISKGRVDTIPDQPPDTGGIIPLSLGLDGQRSRLAMSCLPTGTSCDRLVHMPSWRPVATSSYACVGLTRYSPMQMASGSRPLLMHDDFAWDRLATGACNSPFSSTSPSRDVLWRSASLRHSLRRRNGERSGRPRKSRRSMTRRPWRPRTSSSSLRRFPVKRSTQLPSSNFIDADGRLNSSSSASSRFSSLVSCRTNSLRRLAVGSPPNSWFHSYSKHYIETL